MPNTITNYYTFSPGTKARSSEVNANLDNHRGTLVPINTNTASSSHLTHDIGSSEHRWNVGYFGTLDMAGATTTAALKWDADTANTLGALDLLAGSNTLANFKFGEFGFCGVTTTSYTKFQYQTSSGLPLELLMGATTLASWTALGLKHRTKDVMEFTNAAAPVGTSIYLDQTTLTMNIDTTGSITLCSARLTAKGGGLIEAGIANLQSYIVAASGVFSINLYTGTTTTGMSISGTSFIGSYTLLGGNTTPAAGFAYFHTGGYAAGEVVCEIRLTGDATNNTTSAAGIVRGNFFAREI